MPLLDIQEIRDILPHRYPMLLVDRVLELEEERDHLLKAVILALCVFAIGLLAGIALTIAVVLAFWDHPVCAASILTAIYAGIALFLNSRLNQLLRNWVSFSASVNQLQKDVSCVTEILH